MKKIITAIFVCLFFCTSVHAAWNITWPRKSTGDSMLAEEVNEIRDVVNEKVDKGFYFPGYGVEISEGGQISVPEGLFSLEADDGGIVFTTSTTPIEGKITYNTTDYMLRARFNGEVRVLGPFTAESTPAVTLTQVEAVPAIGDETASYTFSSDGSGAITYGGSCGNGDLVTAAPGNNTVTWTLADGTYSNCTVSAGGNTLNIPAFETTSKYPVVFVHGWLGSSSAWTSDVIPYLITQGWESELLIANSITSSNNVLCGAASVDQVNEVAGWINATLAAYPGFTKVDLVGHSRGGSNINRLVWHGGQSHTKVRRIVTMAGANRDCSPYFPAIPADETVGDILYSVYYSDGDPDQDSGVNYANTYITGAYMENLDPLTHAQMRTAPAALAAMKESLLGNVGSN